jgi:DNA-binding FadR family transcriptional regulator
MSTRVAVVTELLGREICAGTIAVGTPLTAEALQERTGVSRGAVREALSILGSLGLVRSRRRIGFEVLPADEWQRLTPEVMRWRLAAGDSGIVAELTALRRLVEPAAARAAAGLASAEQRAFIAVSAGSMWAAAASGDREGFVAADVALHEVILRASGNSLYLSLGSLFAVSLPQRAPDAESISRDEARAHLDLADAIARGDADAADAGARAIVSRTP